VALTEKGIATPATAVHTLVHEIRHAWQQYYGFEVQAAHGFSEYFLTVALKEADAEAFGRRAQDQYRFYALRKNHKAVPKTLRYSLSKESADLGANFRLWFPLYAGPYGERNSKFYAQALGLDGNTQPSRHAPEASMKSETASELFEFEPESVHYTNKGIDVSNLQNVIALGRHFESTKNYLAALQPDVLPKQILLPSLADTFWGAANDEQRKLTKELRKTCLKQKLAPENRRVRHPWP
jgi:hypothetical protein